MSDDRILVWMMKRGVDGAKIYSDDIHAIERFPEDGDTEPVQVPVERQWYESLPEDWGP